MKHRIDAPCCHGAVHELGQFSDQNLQHTLQRCSDHMERQEKDGRHNPGKTWQSRIFSGQHTVNFCAPHMLAALFWFYHGLTADFFNKIKAHIRNRRRAVQAALRLHLTDDMLEHLFLVFIEGQLLQDQRIALCQLARRKPHRNIRPCGVILDQMHDRVQRAVNGTAVVIRLTEVLSARFFLIFGHMDSVRHQLLDSLVFRSGNRDNRDAETLFHLVDEYGTAVLAHLVHHVERQYHRNVEFHQLHRQIQVPLDIRRIYNIDDAARMLIQDKVPGNDLLARIRRHRINTGKIGDQRIFLAADFTVLPVYRHAGEVSDMLVGSRQLVEQGCLAAVLVSGQCKGQQFSFR